MVTSGESDVRFSVDYPDSLSRLHAVLKLLFGWLYAAIPHGIVLTVLAYVSLPLLLIAFIVILFTGKYPRALFDYMVGLQHYNARLDTYLSFMSDRYPPFSLDAGDGPSRVAIAYPDAVSRGTAILRILLGWLYVGIPHGIALMVLSLIAVVVGIIGFFAILFTGAFPRGMFTYLEGVMRWSLRVNAYLYLLHDRYPPFRLSA